MTQIRTVPKAFSSLICLACAIAIFGLIGNFMHLQSLMMTQNEDQLLFLPQMSYTSARALTGQFQPYPSQPTEEQVFRQLIRSSIASLEECQRQTTTIANNHGNGNDADADPDASQHSGQTPSRTNKAHIARRQLQLEDLSQTAAAMSAPGIQLTRFGLMNALTNHLAIPSPTTTKMCHYPPTTACRSKQYSIIVTSTASNLRILFLNLLSWLTYTSVDSIAVVLLPRLQTNATLESDAKYGNRLLSWHSNPSHKVKLHLVDSLWDTRWSRLVSTEAVVWMDGDIPHVGNNRGLQAGFLLWKENSHELVTSRGWMIERMEPLLPDVESRRLLESSVRTDDKQKPYDTTASNSTLAEEATKPPTHSEGFVSMCKTDNIRLRLDEQEVHVPELNGLIHHRDYLCFLSHKVLGRLRQRSQTLDESRMTIAVLLTQLSQRPLRLYPATVKRPEDNTKTTTTIQGQSQKRLRQRRRLLQQDTNRIRRRRLLLSMDEVMGDESFVSTLMGYFGSMPSESVSWCATTNRCPLHHEAAESNLPWLQKNHNKKC